MLDFGPFAIGLEGLYPRAPLEPPLTSSSRVPHQLRVDPSSYQVALAAEFEHVDRDSAPLSSTTSSHHNRRHETKSYQDRSE